MARMKNINGKQKRLVEYAAARGWRVTRTRGDHIRFDKDGCQSVFTSSTPSDRRATLNAESTLRRAERAAQGVSN